MSLWHCWMRVAFAPATGAALLTSAAIAAPISTAITYQGELLEAGSPADGSFDFEVALFESETGGVDVGLLTFDNVDVINGVFTLELDFGSLPFDGDQLWLQFAVRDGDSGGAFTPLSPRQRIAAAPYALNAEMVTVGGVDLLALADDSVDSDKVVDNSLTADDLAPGAVGASELAPASVDSARLALPLSMEGTTGSISEPILRVIGNELGIWATAPAPIFGNGTFYGVAADNDDDTGSNFTPLDTPDLLLAGPDGVINNTIDDLWLGAQDDVRMKVGADGVAGNGRVQAQAGNGLMFRADADGDFLVNGNLSKGGGSFEIDHPLDPANRILRHSFVESPDMMNIYNGNVVTDGDGLATIELPDYFDALNRDLRYQLTVIGTFARAIVREKIADGRFVIATDQPGVEVSWQVTGIRDDAYARQRRIVVEEDKTGEARGYYLHPWAFGKAPEQSMYYAEQASEDREQ